MLPTSRILSVLLAGVGAALVVAGLLAPNVLLSGNRLPLALGEATWTITDPNGTRDGEAAPVTRQLHMEIQEPSDSDTASVRVGDTLRAGESGSDFNDLLTASTWSFVVDRVTGAATGPAETQLVMGMPATQLPIDGAWLTFPAPATQDTVEVFDPVLRGSAPAEFDGEEEIAGRTVYRYAQHIAPTNVAMRYADPRNTLTLEGENGEPQRTFLHHAADREILVDQETGVVVGIDEKVDDYYADAEGRGVQNVVTYDGVMDRHDVEKLVQKVADAQTVAADRGLWRVLAWVGAALTLAGLAGALRPGRAARRD
ncbi:DUF3068 domain-containing protein [Corynebacterium haemomassiliense]|uniref:DUF3068 domain-containing protein n=1 Tax=Corynebacterium haemomassiliense TaxID=2754726 RepID=UPI00288AB2CD|nr:DUF3068 domain-containing protein [Corynebacterium haemomassiliense]